MPARDTYHREFREALQKDGWTITHDPYNLKLEAGRTYPIDIGAEKLIAAERGAEKIAVEVKSMLEDSLAYEFHGASGQYLAYFWSLPNKNRDGFFIWQSPSKNTPRWNKWYLSKWWPIF